MNLSSNCAILNLTLIDKNKPEVLFCDFDQIGKIVALLDERFSNWQDAFKKSNHQSDNIYDFFRQHFVCHFELKILKEEKGKYSVELTEPKDANFAIYFFKMNN